MQTATGMDVTPATVNQTGEVLLTMSAEAPSLSQGRTDESARAAAAWRSVFRKRGMTGSRHNSASYSTGQDEPPLQWLVIVGAPGHLVE